jgi:hypothetical protein
MKKITISIILLFMLVLSPLFPTFAADQHFDTLKALNEAKTLDEAYKALSHYTVDEFMDFYWKIDNDLSKEAIIERVFSSGQKDKAKDLLHNIASNDKPKFSQFAYIKLYLLGERDSLKGLIDSTNQFGTFRYETTPFPWDILKDALNRYPDSFLANGVREYENITGKPYFMIDLMNSLKWSFYTYGNRSYNPDMEITMLLDFLNKYSAHPAADDAAYRLGRNYEIRGNYPLALKYLYSATTLPDGDNIRYDAEGRLKYVLDVKMSVDDLQSALNSNAVPEEIKPMIEYTKAVKTARDGKFATASELLDRFISKYNNKDIATINRKVSDIYEDNFWENVKIQSDQYKLLANYREKGDNDSLYSMASFIYHNESVFYNHIWNGERQTYMWLGHINEVLPEEKDVYTEYFMSFNNYGQALSIFDVLKSKDPTPQLREKVDYSIALCYSHLMNYSQEVQLLGLYDKYKENTIKSFEYFVDEYPHSTMADDALYALGFITGNNSYFTRILQEYPDGDMINKIQAGS